MFQPRSDAQKIGLSSIKIPCRNGTSFTQDSIVRFELPRNIGFAQLSNAFLEMEIETQNPDLNAAGNLTQPALMLDRTAGASSLISRVSIRSEGRLIEELNGYNVFANLSNNATETQGSINKRTVQEGCASSYMIVDNPYCTTNKCIAPVAIPAVTPVVTGLTNANQCWKPIRRKVCLPLNTGLFNSPHAFGLAMMPLEVELILEKSLRVLRASNPGDSVTTMVGESLAGGVGAYQRRQIIISNRSIYNGIGGNAPVPAAAANTTQRGEQNLNMLNNFPLRVGQVVRLSDGGSGVIAAPGNFAIEAIWVQDSATATNPGHVGISFAVDVTGGGAQTDINVDLLALNGAPLAEHGNFNYRVSNPRMVIPKVVPPPETVNAMYQAMSKGAISQEIVTYTCYDNAIPASQTTSTSIIPANLSRCKSILSVPISQDRNDNVLNSNTLCGQFLDATQYEYQINNKLVPDRRCDLTREAAANAPLVGPGADGVLKPYRLGTHPGGFHLFESEKALRSADIKVKNLNFITQNANVAAFNADESGSWFVGRSLSAGVGTSQNLIGKSAILYLDYTANSNMVKLLRNFVVHIRTIQFGQDGVQVFY
tara:strand:- start:1826 stop:3616 length:1791 start_codon:yes stop_codon:yes gene_type:complete